MMDAKQGSSAGGLARAAKLTPERRREIARAAIAARWSNRKPKPSCSVAEAFGAIESALRERGPAASMAVGPLLRIKALLVEG